MIGNENRPIVYQEPIRKAQTDKDSPKSSVDDPETALSQLGDRLPENAEARVDNPDELSEEQLNSVVGGKGPRQSCYG